jgi:ankyrin repeat protein
LDELPQTLDGTYEQTLRNIDKEKRDYACRLFQSLVVSKRPLRVEELAELFAIRHNAEAIPTFDASLRPENPEEFVRSTCSTLVAVVNDNGQKIVQFSHFSVREYLVSDRIKISGHVPHFHILPRPAHVLLARACLSVLLQLHDRVDRDNIEDFPMALYAAQYWVDHAQFENISSDIQQGIECLFNRNKPFFAAWIRLYNIDDPTGFHAPPHLVPLYYAVLCGFSDIAEHIVNAHPQDVNARGGRRITPLHAALETGHQSIAVLLLERGADIGSRGSRNQTPLHIAAYRGYAEVVSLLTNRGADLNAVNAQQETPLHLSSLLGHKEIVRLLSDRGADANHLDDLGRTPLYHASLRGDNDTVQLLLDHGAVANHQDCLGRTALHHASLRGYKDIVRLLLKHGADANHLENLGWTALHHASLRGYKDIVQLLLDHDAVSNHPDKLGRTALHHASGRGHNYIVQLLLDHGVVADHLDNLGRTPLYYAKLQDHNDIVQLLLDRSAVANPPDNPG